MNITEKLLLWIVLNEKIKNLREEISLSGQSYTEGRRTLGGMSPGKERAELASALSEMKKSMKKPGEEHHALIMTWKKLDEEIERFINEN